MFRKWYDQVLIWSAHRHAPAYLCALSFAESSVLPVPPDVMLAPMSLARPDRAWYFALICSLSSVVGGMFGYLLGSLAFGMIESWLMSSVYADAFLGAVAAFEQYGFWYILLAGFTPIPYKVFTISAGVVGMPVVPFLAGSLAGRAGRFFLVASLINLGGERLERSLRKWVDLIGWLVLALAAIVVLVWKLSSS